MITAFVIKVLGLPKKLWNLLVLIFNKLMQVIKFIFIEIPKKLWGLVIRIVEFFKVLFIPNYKKPAKKKVINKRK